MSERTTYASLALNENDHLAYEEALKRFKPEEHYPLFISSKPTFKRRAVLQNFSPSNIFFRVSTFPQGTVNDTEQAVENAKKTCASIKKIGWEKRLEILVNAKKLIAQRKYDIAAILTYEIGKVRGEALAEVNEVTAMIEAYEKFLKEANFYRCQMNDGSEFPYEKVVISMEPLGGPVAVIVPFNFPFALCANMSMSAFLAGNPVVIKPSSDAPLSALQWRNIMVEAGVPEEACLFLAGPGSTMGEALIHNPNLAGIAFTGSRDVALHINTACAQMAEKGYINRRFVSEMGGKNPAIVSRQADLKKAALGILRSAIGYGGQKCSACSRVYVEKPVSEELLRLLIDPDTLAPFIVDDPAKKATFVGPLINQKAFEKYWQVSQRVLDDYNLAVFYIYNRANSPVGELAEVGYFVEPLLAVMNHQHALSREELFVPFISLMTVDSFEEGIEKANDTVYGLTAGVFTEDPEEQALFFEKIEAGVVYSNRKAGGTTGSWPTLQSFGGWKMSGLRGVNAFGPWYPTAFAREQCKTMVLR